MRSIFPAFEGTFLNTRVARRILFLFVCCAVLPITLLAAISYRSVSRQLRADGYARLRQASKAAGMGIMQRLQFLEGQLRTIDPGRGTEPPAGTTSFRTASRASWIGFTAIGHTGFTATTDNQDDGRLGPGAVGGPDLTALSADQRDHLLDGGTLLLVAPAPGERARLTLILDPDGTRRLRWGEIDTGYLFGSDTDQSDVPAGMVFCVVGKASERLFCPIDVRDALRQVRDMANDESIRQVEWRADGTRYFGAVWPLFLGYKYAAPEWNVVVGASEADVLAPMRDFRAMFPLVLLLSLIVVLLLSNIQIRRSLEPLERLGEGTRRIAAGDYETRVAVRGGDEFEILASSFNGMADRIARQFRALNTINELDRAILSSLDRERILRRVVDNIAGVVPCEAACMLLLTPRVPNEARVFVSGIATDRGWGRPTFISDQDLRLFDVRTDVLLVDRSEPLPHFITPELDEAGFDRWTIFPLFIKGNVTGVITLALAASRTLADDEIMLGRRLADQVAVALANADLVEELDATSWGALRALARAIDAKSPWTAGHSERVTSTALAIARALELDDHDLDVLRRGGLLHDVGKIGVPAAVLDKPGPLTSDEWLVMQSHVRVGVRILEPFTRYADILPIVLYHHEKFDGSGYPDGLRRDQIPLLARILAVADVFDALSSDRPYRDGMSTDAAIEIIREESGSHFDPMIVDAFLRVADEVASSYQPRIEASLNAPEAVEVA